MRSGVRVAMLALCMAGCDRMVTPRHSQQLKDAETKVAAGDFTRAISLYESALEDRPTDSEVHYKLALLYDDKLNDPLNALHHFRRYLAIAPGGTHAPHHVPTEWSDKYKGRFDEGWDALREGKPL